jgi:hypothetical protein
LDLLTATSELSALAMAELPLTHVHTRGNQSVHGLNLTVPEDARAVIKPWNERDDTEFFAESGVDDQVRCVLCPILTERS